MLTDQIQSDTKNALKAGDAFLLSTLRMVQSALKNRALEKRAKEVKSGGVPEDAALTDEEVISVIRSEVKKRKEAASEFEKGARRELAEKESKEAKLLEAYLPEEPDDADIERVVSKIIEELGKDSKLFGKIMGMAVKRLPAASGDRVSQMVKKLLND